jgi:predicted acetyltransferase
MELVWPAPPCLRSYREALQRGWSPNNLRPQAGQEELAAIGKDPDAYLRELVNLEGGGAGVKLPDGSVVPRLPAYRKWMWDGEFCGAIQLRWSASGELPEYCLGHIGYAVVPWKQRRGYATRALGLMLSEARERGMSHVEITTSPQNLGSQKVILANKGVLIEKFEKLPSLGGGPELRYKVAR